MLEYVKWPVLGYLAIYLGLVIIRNPHLKYSSKDLSSAKRSCDIDRKVDISDSRLSNFDSDSSERNLDTSEMLTVDRVFPLTKTLNRAMDKIFRKLSLLVTLEDKKTLSLTDEYLNLTYFEDSNNETEHKVFGRNAYVSRLDSLKRVGNAFISEDTDTKIVIVQKLQFQVLKESYDFYSEDSSYLGGCSFTFTNNAFQLVIELSTSYDNSDCSVKRVNFNCISDKSMSLTVEGLSGTEGLYQKLKTLLYGHFVAKVLPVIENALLPSLMTLIDQADVCSYFDARDKDSVDR
ncbi:uncharacterized protein LOC128997107 [Macrosteles quadrilineatus]|uniref:uncharacterized protein LOC128997107 n=1 Tax=Macrosteles quadrilineatus TaxID=74068 RepID=UPI0023E0F9D9|nr:uncharacterized protein LOC128997107 [Macrosteles quadrilineatus]